MIGSVFRELAHSTSELAISSSTASIEAYVTMRPRLEQFTISIETRDGFRGTATAENDKVDIKTSVDVDCRSFPSDTIMATQFEGIASVYDRPLWPEPASNITEWNEQLVAFFLARKSEFGFWHAWYQGFLDGKPLDWDLQRRVALIPDDDWAKGPEHIAKCIAEIRARFVLEQRIAALEEELRATAVSRHGMGGNFPPEPVDEAMPVAKELLIIWEPLQEIKQELAAEEPDTGRIRKALELLAVALKSGVVWCAKKADLAVDSAIKWAIPAGGTGYLALHPDKLVAVIEAGKTFLATLF